MVTRFIITVGRLPGADTFLSFIGRRILGAFSLIRTAILVMGIANVLLFQYLDSAEARERNKLAEQGKLDHLTFVVQTQIQSYESAVWQTGRLPSTISSARDIYTTQATGDLLALRKLDQSIVAPGGALHDFVDDYLKLNQMWQTIVPAIEQGGSQDRLHTLWNNQQALVANTPALIDAYRAQAQEDLAALQRDKLNAKQIAMAVSLVTSLISFGLSIALAIVLTRQIVPPVTRLRDALQQVAAGDLSPRAQVRGKDEISELLRTFNAAIAGLHNLLMEVRSHSLGISAESRRLRQIYVDEGHPAAESAVAQPDAQVSGPGAATPQFAQLAELAQATADVAQAPSRDVAARPSGEDTETVADINQLIGQVALVAHNASLLAESARQAATVAPHDSPAFAPLVANLRALDAEAHQMGEQLRVLVAGLQSAQNRIADSTANLDRAAEDLRLAVEHFHLQTEGEISPP